MGLAGLVRGYRRRVGVAVLALGMLGGVSSGAGVVGAAELTTRICFYDGADSSFNRSGKSYGPRVLVSVPLLSVEYVDGSGVRATRVSPDGCIDVARRPFESIRVVDTPGYYDYEFSLGQLGERYNWKRGDWSKRFFFVIPDDAGLVDRLPWIGQHNRFRGHGPGSKVKYRTIERLDKRVLDGFAKSFYAQVGFIDVDPINGNKTYESRRFRIVSYKKNPRTDRGFIRMAPGGFSFSGKGPVMRGGFLQYQLGFDSTERLVYHEFARSLSPPFVGAPRRLELFSDDGSLVVTKDDARALRLATNMAGFSLPGGIKSRDCQLNPDFPPCL